MYLGRLKKAKSKASTEDGGSIFLLNIRYTTKRLPSSTTKKTTVLTHIAMKTPNLTNKALVIMIGS
jgi:hypothetical protein